MELIAVVATIVHSIALVFEVVQTLSVVTLHHIALAGTVLLIAVIRALGHIIAPLL